MQGIDIILLWALGFIAAVCVGLALFHAWDEDGKDDQ